MTLCGGTARGVLVALDGRNGRQLWRRETAAGNHKVSTDLLVSGALVFVSDISGAAVHAVDAATGRPAWSAPIPGRGPTRMLVQGDVLYALRWGMEQRHSMRRAARAHGLTTTAPRRAGPSTAQACT